MKKVDLPISVTGLLYAVTKAVVYAVGILMMLNAVGVSITPIITALGVGGLAMALALQDTLSNLFAGIHILAEHTIRVGDFIKLETGQEGFVEDISWRTTRIRMLPNNMVIVPNSKLAQSVVTNYYLPERRAMIQVPISVSYDADADMVERVLLDEAIKAATEVPGLLREPAPAVRFVPGFGASSLDFTLACHVREIIGPAAGNARTAQKDLETLQASSNIDIPYPTRTVYLKGSGTRTVCNHSLQPLAILFAAFPFDKGRGYSLLSSAPRERSPDADHSFIKRRRLGRRGLPGHRQAGIDRQERSDLSFPETFGQDGRDRRQALGQCRRGGRAGSSERTLSA